MTMKKTRYFDILTTEGATEATILLYGYIGEYYDWDAEKGWHQAGVTDIAFVQEMERLAAQYDTIHVRINSPGGEIFHGSAIVTAIRNCPKMVHTWIDGVAASMAGIIFLAGHKRHMAKNGMLMLHSGSAMCWGNAADMRETADILDKFDETLIIAAADATGMEQAGMKEKYFDYKDHWLTYNDVNAEGWLSEPDDYKSEAPMPEDIQKMTYRDLVQFFNQMQQKQDPVAEDQPPHEAAGLFARLRAVWGKTIAAVTAGGKPNQHLSPTEIQNMNLDDFKNSLTAGTLNLDEVKAHLATLEPAPPAEPAAPPATTAPAAEPQPNTEVTALQEQVKSLTANVEKLTGLVTAYGGQPGAGKSTPATPATDLPSPVDADSPEARYKAMNAKLAEAANRNEPVSFTPQ